MSNELEDIADLIEAIEDASVELLDKANVDLLCNVFGDVIHGVICSDDTISDEVKAAHVTLLIGQHLTSRAIAHFDTDNLPDRINDLITAQSMKGRLH